MRSPVIIAFVVGLVLGFFLRPVPPCKSRVSSLGGTIISPISGKDSEDSQDGISSIKATRFFRDKLSDTPGYLKRHSTSQGTFHSELYWESRYKNSGNSGKGSYGRAAIYKARIINSFVEQNNVSKVIDFGVGDGNQLQLAQYPKYIGVDVSETIISRLKDKFKADTMKRFYVFNTLAETPGEFFRTHEFPSTTERDPIIENNINDLADLSLSVDVIYHLVEDHVCEQYLEHLFATSRRYVIIYAWNSPDAPVYLEANDDLKQLPANHVRYRQFVPFIHQHFPHWRLINAISGPCDGKDFFFFQRSQ